MTIPAVQIEFIAKGVPDIQRAFRTVQQTFIDGQRAQTRTQTSEQRVRERLIRAEQTAADKAIKEEAKAVERAAKDKIRAWQVADREHRKALDSGLREAQRAAKEETRAFEAAEREKNASARQWLARREAEERASLHRREQFARTVVGAAGQSFKTVGRGIAHVGAAVLNAGGGFTVADSITERTQLERSAAYLSNSAYQGKGERPNPVKIMDAAKAASIRTGMDANELVKGVQSFTAKTGKFGEGMDNLEFFGKVAKGTGASIEDVANTAGILRVQNKDLSPEKMQQMILSVISQGKKGSIEFPELAHAAGKMTRTSASYAGDQAENQAKLLGLAQIGMRTAGSADEAATMLSNISADAMKHSDKVTAKLGKGAFNKQGQITAAPEEFIAEIMSKSGGNLQEIQKMGFGARSMKMFQALAPTYNKALEEHKDAKKAILEDIHDVTAGKYDTKDLDKDVAQILKTSAEQFEGAVRELKMAVGEQLVPALKDLVPIIKDLIPTLRTFLQGLVEVAGWAKNHPFAGLGIAIGALITKEIVAAKIAQTIQSLIAGKPAPGVGGGGGPGGIGPVGGAAAGATAAYVIAKNDIDAGLEGQVAGQKKVGELTSDLKRGGKGAQAALEEIDRAKSEYGGIKGIGTIAANALTMPSEMVYSALTGEKNTSKENIKKAFEAREIIDSDGIRAAVTKAVADGVTQGAKNSSTDVSTRTQPITVRTGK